MYRYTFALDLFEAFEVYICFRIAPDLFKAASRIPCETLQSLKALLQADPPKCSPVIWFSSPLVDLCVQTPDADESGRATHRLFLDACGCASVSKNLNLVSPFASSVNQNTQIHKFETEKVEHAIGSEHSLNFNEFQALNYERTTSCLVVHRKRRL